MAKQPIPKTIQELCTPAAIYFLISIVTLFVIALQNMGNTNKYCVGTYACDVPSTMLVYAIEIIYVLFFTWVLHLICKAGYTSISWVLLLLPYILFFVLLALFMLSGM
tara:strand:+ start:1465 stop:1788 length:324 start_codon:yes stop_codon:yes gene_type:complete